ncbi:MAG: methyltransferase domain-containing protein [Candidatus Aenigmarchaeota archaeon]|nr:methyltransferase domain-containing protein [Candidatus Aenigmarchaeota archaeon]
MRYFSEKEKSEKERAIASFPRVLQRLFRKTLSIHDCYDEMLAPLIAHDIVVLDAGCGKKGIMNKYIHQTRIAVGIDLQIDDLKRNQALDAFALGFLEALPFGSNCFDVIVCQWVIEHLAHPKRVFREFARVLKPRGHLIVVTNSILNPLMLISFLLPRYMRDFLKKSLMPTCDEEDTFPTYYRCNSISKLSRILARLGFQELATCYSGDHSLFIFNQTIFKLILLFEKITNVPWFRPFKMHIAGHYQKVREV